jgi:hypothetical protein
MQLQLSDNNIAVTNKTVASDKILSNIAKLIALCLVSSFFSYFSLRSLVLQEIAFLALSVPALLQIHFNRTNIRAAHRCFVFSLFYLIPVLLSFLFNLMIFKNNGINEIIIMINLFYGFYIASIFANGKPYDLMPHILKYVFLFSLPIFAFVVVSQQHAYVWGRWTPFGHQPNWWGMMALGAAWGATALNNIKFRIAAFAFIFLFMVELQSRGSIVALMPVFLLSYGFFLPLTSKKVLWIFIGIIALLIGGIFSEILLDKGIFEYTIDYITKEILLFNDPHRGINSGLTGRTEGYLLAWKGFLESPIFGNGIGEYEFVHNGFLLTLAETGLLGLAGMIIILGRCLSAILKNGTYTQLGLFLSYLAALLTFPRSFNINMTGFIFIILIMKGHYARPERI